MRGSNARGCVYLITALRRGVETINGTIGRNSSEGVSIEFSSRDYDDIVYIYDWEEDGVYGRLPIAIAVSDAQECLGNYIHSLNKNSF